MLRGKVTLKSLLRKTCDRMSSLSSLGEHSNYIQLRSLHALVDHSIAYESNMLGNHGKQLSLTYKETVGKNYLSDDILDEVDALDGDDENQLAHILNGDAESYDSGDTASAHEPGPGTGEGVQLEYNADGSLKMDAVAKAILKAGAPAGGFFAVIQLPNGQYKVAVDDLIVCNKLLPIEKWSVGATLTLEGTEVLMIGSVDKTVVGLPGVANAKVTLMVEEITRDATVLVFKKRRRKNSRRKNGFRREVSMLRVLDVSFEGMNSVQRESVASL